jgi:hypothetical protein
MNGGCMLKWLLNNQKSIAISIFVTLVLLLVWNLWTMINHLDMSYMYTHSLESNSTDLSDMAQQWAIRGQMGDILSGHFSALAFLAVALSVFLQNEANRHMKLAFVQQSEALVLQSKSLEAQIEELKQSRKESERQTEEFFIANMNVKLDRYYAILDEKVKIINEDLLEKYRIDRKHFSPEYKEGFETYSIREVPLREVVRVVEFIYDEIQAIEQQYPSGYILFLKELKLRMKSSLIFSRIYTEFEGAKNSKAFSLLRAQT